jgi:hypothetical protein
MWFRSNNVLRVFTMNLNRGENQSSEDTHLPMGGEFQGGMSVDGKAMAKCPWEGTPRSEFPLG